MNYITIIILIRTFADATSWDGAEPVHGVHGSAPAATASCRPASSRREPATRLLHPEAQLVQVLATEEPLLGQRGQQS